MRKLIFPLIGFVLAAGCSSASKPSSSSPPTSSVSTPTKSDNQATPNKEPKVMKFGSVAAKDQPITKGAYKFKELVEKGTNGSIKVEIYTDGQLGGDIKVVDSLKSGTVEATNVSTAPLAAAAPRFSAFDLPFLFKDEQTAYRVLDGPIGEEVLGDLPKSGLIGLGYWENGFRYLTNNIKEVKNVQEIKGLKIRTLENKLHVDTWKELGTNPSPIPFPELFAALEQKVVDGEENSLSNIRYNKFYEVQKYLTDTGHVYSPSVMLISKKFWDKLSDEEKKVLKTASDEARDYERQLSQQDNKESIKFLEDQGMKITHLTPEARQGFKDAMSPIYEKYKPEFGKEFVEKLIESTK